MSDEMVIADENENTEVEEVNTPSDGEWTAPSKEEWDRVIKAKDRYKTEAKTRREKLEELQKNVPNSDTANDTEQVVARARLEGENGATARYRAIIGKQAAKAAFLEAGLTGKPDGLLKLIDFDDLEINEDGDVDGLDDQVTQIKGDYPELFRKSRVTSAIRGRDGSDKKPVEGKVLSISERLLAQARQAR